MKITNTDKIVVDWSTNEAKIPDEYLMPEEEYAYKVLNKNNSLGMKPVGRVYYGGLKNLNYTDGSPKESPLIDGGEIGVIDRYLRAGVSVYTAEQVENIINSRCYEVDDKMKPKITNKLSIFLKEIANGTAKNKNKRAKEFLEYFKVIGEEEADD